MSSSIKFRCLDDSGDNIFLVDLLSAKDPLTKPIKPMGNNLKK